jgi:predicted RNA binding protein YcfA (HicA-like mRNA interferase family)
MKVRDVMRALRDDGWIEIQVRGSHRQLKHSTKSNDDLAPGTLNSILKQAGLRR